ncbi:uncharacterized protein LOC127283489 [Leptopilina boulardi]|uniref:uncharacterized protein LOC127283489 n=1 Tax=Leptopilina boulardi TaxID=63433 RepID=UPI0021F56DA8|nr:uncharacterized protein LOC127283489 [Leptopilina boulardi]
MMDMEDMEITMTMDTIDTDMEATMVTEDIMVTEVDIMVMEEDMVDMEDTMVIEDTMTIIIPILTIDIQVDTIIIMQTVMQIVLVHQLDLVLLVQDFPRVTQMQTQDHQDMVEDHTLDENGTKIAKRKKKNRTCHLQNYYGFFCNNKLIYNSPKKKKHHSSSQLYVYSNQSFLIYKL